MLDGDNCCEARCLASGCLAPDRLASGGAFNLARARLQLLHSEGSNEQALASLALTANSTIGLNDSSLSFGGPGNTLADVILTIDGYVAPASSNDALRQLGNHSGNANLETPLADAALEGFTSACSFDGTYTDVCDIAAVAEQRNAAMLLAGRGLADLIGRRREPAKRHLPTVPSVQRPMASSGSSRRCFICCSYVARRSHCLRHGIAGRKQAHLSGRV